MKVKKKKTRKFVKYGSTGNLLKVETAKAKQLRWNSKYLALESSLRVRVASRLAENYIHKYVLD